MWRAVRVSHLGLCAGLRFSGELDLGGFEDGVFLEDVLLRLVVTKRLAKNKNKKTNHNVHPHIFFLIDLIDSIVRHSSVH